MSQFVLRNRRVLTQNVTRFYGPNTNLHRVTFQPWLVFSKRSTGNMKRKATDAATDSKAKRQRDPQPDYCDVEPREDGHGNAIWPASEQSIHSARELIKEW